MALMNVSFSSLVPTVTRKLLERLGVEVMDDKKNLGCFYLTRRAIEDWKMKSELSGQWSDFSEYYFDL